MSKRDRRIRVRAERREPLDVRKLGRALLALALAQAQEEADAQAEHATQQVEEETPRAA